VGYAGPFVGWVRLTVPQRLLESLAETMLGAPGTPEEQRDALGEVVNVICGNFLPRLAGSDAVFRVLAPVIMPPEKSEPPQARVQVVFDEGWAQLALRVQPAAQPVRATA
jgi:CheY-specific phosphatase CheX